MFTGNNSVHKLPESPPQARGRNDETIEQYLSVIWSHDQRNFRYRKSQGAVQEDEIIFIKNVETHG